MNTAANKRAIRPGSEDRRVDPADYPITGRIWWLTISPSVWALHLLLCYIAAAIFCAKAEGEHTSLLPIRYAAAVLTIVALAAIIWVGRASYQQHRMDDSPTPHDFSSQDDQQRFIGFAAFLLSLLSGVATLYTAAVFIFLKDCH